jgi:excisionase family DNA binding protein
MSALSILGMARVRQPLYHWGMESPDLTRAEAAQYLHCSQRKLDALIAACAITYRRQGRRILIPREALDAYRAATTIEAAARENLNAPGLG